MTKRESYNAIRTIVADNADLVAFIDHELELLDKKNSYKSTKPSAKQLANEDIKDAIVAVLGGATEPMTCKAIAEGLGHSTQKVSALLSQLIAEGTVSRDKVKRVPVFALV